MNDAGLAHSDAPAAHHTRIAGHDDQGHPPRPKPLISVVRGTANVLTLIGAILIALGWAQHWPPYILGRVALLTLTTFIISFIAILIENRRHPEADDE